MFQPRNHEHQQMKDIPIKQVTPIRNRAPTPIHKVPLKVMQNKENNPRTIQTEHMVQKPLLNKQRNKKPLISPMRNPFNQNSQRQDQYSSNPIMQRNNISQNFYEQNQSNNFNFKAHRTSNVYKNYPMRESSNDIYESSNNCANHANKMAEYVSYVEDNQILYCGKCAAQLASQGFQVKKIEPMTVKKGNTNINNQNRIPNRLPRYPEYQGNPMYELIVQFLSELKTVEDEHNQNMLKLQNIDQHYSSQIQYANNFYDDLIEFLQQMKQDHIADLQEQQRKHSQIAIIEHDYLRQNIDEMEIIYNDIQENLEKIFEIVQQNQLKVTLNRYRQKTQVYRHKTEEQAQFFQEVIDFSPEEISQKLEAVQGYLMDVWNEPKSKNLEKTRKNTEIEQKNRPPPREYQKQAPQNQNRMIRAPPQHQQQQLITQNQPAFRRLFEDEEALMAETSPQFKKI